MRTTHILAATEALGYREDLWPLTHAYPKREPWGPVESSLSLTRRRRSHLLSFGWELRAPPPVYSGMIFGKPGLGGPAKLGMVTLIAIAFPIIIHHVQFPWPHSFWLRAPLTSGTLVA